MQISKEQALAAFEARLEADRLIAYRRQTERLIRRPAEEFRLFVQQVFSPFSGTPWCPTPISEKPIEKADPAAANFKSVHFQFKSLFIIFVADDSLNSIESIRMQIV